MRRLHTRNIRLRFNFPALSKMPQTSGKRKAPTVNDHESTERVNDETAQELSTPQFYKRVLRSGKSIDDGLTSSKMKLDASLESTDERESESASVDMERVGAIVRAIVEEASIGNDMGIVKGAVGKNPSASDEYPRNVVVVGGYHVRLHYADTTRKILDKYGDILASTGFEGRLVPKVLMEYISGIYQTLEKSTLESIEVPWLQDMRQDVHQFLKYNADVSWLAKRLDEIYDGKMVLQMFSNAKEESKQSQRIISELEKELELQRTILKEVHDKVQELDAKLEAEKTSQEALLNVCRFGKNLLVDI